MPQKNVPGEKSSYLFGGHHESFEPTFKLTKERNDKGPPRHDGKILVLASGRTRGEPEKCLRRGGRKKV